MSDRVASVVLGVLDSSGQAMTVRELISETGHSRGSVTYAVRSLERRGVLRSSVRERKLPGRSPLAYERNDQPLSESTVGPRISEELARFDDGVYEPTPLKGDIVPPAGHTTGLSARKLATVRVAWMVRRRNELCEQMDEMRLAHERNPVPGLRAKLRDLGGEIREMDIRINELQRLLRRTDEDRLTE